MDLPDSTPATLGLVRELAKHVDEREAALQAQIRALASVLGVLLDALVSNAPPYEAEFARAVLEHAEAVYPTGAVEGDQILDILRKAAGVIDRPATA